MIDAEVIRLRRLRNTALRARAIATAMNARQIDGGSALARSALACWRIARAVTGKLRAHPYRSYQRDSGALRSLYDGAAAAALAAAAQYRGASFTMYSTQLQRVARELDDARALTWSPTLSDTLGRSQSEIRALILEVAAGARRESTRRAAAPVRDDALRADAVRNDAARAGAVHAAANGPGARGDASRIAIQWPYLAF